MESIQKFLKQEKQNKIDSLEVDTSDLYKPLFVSYKERQHYIFRMRYKRKYRFGEVFNRIYCVEKNKPNETELAEIAEKLDGDYSKENVYKYASYNQRKHLTYIYLKLNYSEMPSYNPYIRECLIHNLIGFYSAAGARKDIKYQLVIDVIAEHMNFDTRKLLYFKDNPKLRQYVKEVLEI